MKIVVNFITQSDRNTLILIKWWNYCVGLGCTRDVDGNLVGDVESTGECLD